MSCRQARYGPVHPARRQSRQVPGRARRRRASGKHNDKVAWHGARSMPNSASASGLRRRPQRKIARRSLAPASIAATAMASTACSGNRRPLRPRRSAIAPKTSHSDRPMKPPISSAAPSRIRFARLVSPYPPRFFESPWQRWTQSDCHEVIHKSRPGQDQIDLGSRHRSMALR